LVAGFGYYLSANTSPAISAAASSCIAGMACETVPRVTGTGRLAVGLV
jgi:hypothetical protein